MNGENMCKRRTVGVEDRFAAIRVRADLFQNFRTREQCGHVIRKLAEWIFRFAFVDFPARAVVERVGKAGTKRTRIAEGDDVDVIA